MDAPTATQPPQSGNAAGATDDAQEGRQGSELMDAAARGAGLTHGEEDALLGFFLGNQPAPNTTVTKAATVDLGDGREWHCTIRSIEWSEWQDAQTRGVDSKGDFNMLVQASYAVARACVKPDLGPMLKRINEERKAKKESDPTAPDPLPDSAAMLRVFFARQAGALIYLQRMVLNLSKLDEEGQGGVKEVEAAKNS